MRTAQHWTNDARLCLVYAGTGSQLEHDVLLNLFSQCQSDALESAAKIADNLQSQLDVRAQLRAMKYYEDCSAIQYVDSLITALDPPCEHGSYSCEYANGEMTQTCNRCKATRKLGDWKKPEVANEKETR